MYPSPPHSPANSLGNYCPDVGSTYHFKKKSSRVVSCFACFNLYKMLLNCIYYSVTCFFLSLSVLRLVRVVICDCISYTFTVVFHWCNTHDLSILLLNTWVVYSVLLLCNMSTDACV